MREITIKFMVYQKALLQDGAVTFCANAPAGLSNKIGDTNMKVELAFDDVPDDIEGAIADIHVEDQSEADAPAPRLFSGRVGPFAIQRLQPTVTMDVELTVPAGGRELALVVRVRAHTQGNQPIEFLNTTTTPLPKEPSPLVRVMLSRVM
jgi:hypothetical protein